MLHGAEAGGKTTAILMHINTYVHIYLSDSSELKKVQQKFFCKVNTFVTLKTILL